MSNQACACKSLLFQDGSSIVAILQQIQEQHNYLPEDALKEVSRKTGVPLIEIYRVATFYKSFSLTPKGRHKVVACSGTACHLRGSERITGEISRILGVQPGATTADGIYTLEKVNCLGACALAPLVVIDGRYHANLTPGEAGKIICRHRDERSAKQAGIS